MGRIEETDRTIDLITNSYPVKTQEYLMLKEIARSVAVLADNMSKPVKPFHVVHKDKSSIYPPRNFVIDWQAGNAAARDDIKEFAKKHYDKFNDKTQWDAGYRHAMIDVMEYIERM